MRRALILLFLLILPVLSATAEDGHQAWLRYARLDRALAQSYRSLPSNLVVLGDSAVLRSAQSEWIRGVHGMLGGTIRPRALTRHQSFVIIGTREKVIGGLGDVRAPDLAPDGYWLASVKVAGEKMLVIAGGSDRGALYGIFAMLSKIARGENIDALNEVQNPAAPLRWINQWDNLNGSIERGYAGNSIFFEKAGARTDLHRAGEYARLLASIGINACAVNNVNADPRVLNDDFLPDLERIAAAMRPYGVQLAIAINVSKPKQAGELGTFDPLDPRVQTWWNHKFDTFYRAIPDLAGVVVKADSEGQLGPSVYGRNAAQAANVIARAIRPHHGVVFYRAFEYDHHLDWHDPKADRARAAYDIFHPLDGQFDDNVIVQIKNGPIDFQVREPASPLFGGMPRTNEAIELQITQEYTGQQKHTVYLAPMWKQTLDFDMRVDGRSTLVRDIVVGKSFARPLGGFVGVANVGLDENWLGNDLALANLYAFGRLAWNPELSAESIVEEWTRLIFGNDPEVIHQVRTIQMASWPAYEHYTGPLGLQSLTNITGPHYGPAPESQEKNGWGQWIRAEHDGVGMDRTVATGTGFVGQYSPEVQERFEYIEHTPENLLLFFHHLPYSYRLHSGKSVIQALYDLHYQGAEEAQGLVDDWKSLAHRVDDQRYNAGHAQLSYQADHAKVWRDAINDWFLKTSGIPDEHGRVGHHPGRIEAESMKLENYRVVEVTSWEGASGGKAVSCPREGKCSAETKFDGAPGQYDLAVQYFDLRHGVATFRFLVNGRVIDSWKADQQLPGDTLSADSSVRRHIPSVTLHTGDVLRMEGIEANGDLAALDYLEITRRHEEGP